MNLEDDDFDIFLDKIKTDYKDSWTEENWEEVSKPNNYKTYLIIFNI